MIDIENDIFVIVKNAVKAVYHDISVTNDASNTPSSFPHVTIVEEDNNIYTPMRTDNVENYANLIYDVNVYSDKQNGRKSECRAIMAVINDTMSEHNFTRVIMRPVPNMQDNMIYRITARYRAIADRNKTIFQS